MAWHYSNRIEFKFEYSNCFDSMCYALPGNQWHKVIVTELVNWQLTQGVITELHHHLTKPQDLPNSNSQTEDAEGLLGEKSEESTIKNLELFTTNDKVFESLSGDGSNRNLSKVDSEWS
ncbi:hypothetical protein PSTG_12121 [Puccinia striiformis f. sp. tritici PST-78]|uniref:Uncharacterized protein n=1 Tax=Puccinia striiformis f. sp. tritici PST-78 TaxID=1165861 RepID=A0A0L0V6G4_9BASI|nr:hypothetical protein PSTG_12121 [Puccinia striiformis f. sp. tritici PST-78]